MLTKIFDSDNNEVCRINVTPRAIVYEKDGQRKRCRIGDEIATPIGVGIVQQFSNGFRILMDDGDIYQFPWMDLISIL